MNHRVQVSLGFLASGLSLMFITLFAVFGKLEPLLRGGDPGSPEIQALLAEIYPFESVAEVRAIYGVVCLVPILAPILSGARVAAWLAFVIGLLTTLINLQDAVAAYMLNGEIVFGAAFLVSVGAPAIIGLIAAWRWARSPA
jgi:hypothetical protein